MPAIDRVFSSYQDALSQCGPAYDDDDISLVVARKTLAIVPLLKQMLLDPDPLAVSLLSVMSAARNATPVKVLDVGGGCGYHFFAAKAILPDIPLSWHVVETKTMSAQARKHFAIEGLEYFSSIDEAIGQFGGSVDLVHTSSTIQYVEYPEDLVDRLVRVAAHHILVARFPIFDGARTVGVQASRLSDNGPGPMPEGIPDKIVQYPVTFCNKDDIAGRLLAAYDLTSQFTSAGSSSMVGDKLAVGASFMLRRKG